MVHQITLKRISAPLGRMLSILLIHITHVSTFLFAAKSNINGGIISTIFSSSCVFTTLIFYLKYGQKITKNDFLGTFFILGCVGLISLGGSNQSGEVDSMYLALALTMALLAGLSLSLNTLAIQHVIETGFNMDQSDCDANLLVGLLYLPFTFWFRG
jgi:drug/metabolite transporter (DMT)-like permease